ncbi:MAG: molybdenum cofactor guanylyltransferase MobA, partial [Rhizobiaceae bacterium]
LWPVGLAADLRAALDAGRRGVGAFIAAQPHCAVEFDAAGTDPFFNINTPDDLAEAGRIAAG